MDDDAVPRSAARMRGRELVSCIAVAAAAALLLSVGAVAARAPAPEAGDPEYHVLVFSKTTGYRHASIPEGVAAIRALGSANHFTVTATEDAGAFTSANLARYRAVVWLNTTGDVLDPAQQVAFEGYIRAGGGYVGVHAAADTEFGWPWYGGLVGAYYRSHPGIRRATVEVADRAHAGTARLDRRWSREDEWYDFRTNPRGSVHVLATLDESSYTGGTMGADHPIAWCHEYGGGRAFYTAGGHTEAAYREQDFAGQLLGGIRYAAGLARHDCRPEAGYTALYDGDLAGWRQAGPGHFDQDDATLTSSGGMGLLWYAAKELRAYSLKLDWRLRGDDNSGVFVGFPAGDDPNGAVANGYEVQIDASDDPERTTGAVYGFKGPDVAARDAALNPPGAWNTFEIRVEGERLQVFLNGVKVNDFTNSVPARSLRSGYLGIQNHGPGDQVSFRNLRIRELPGPT